MLSVIWMEIKKLLLPLTPLLLKDTLLLGLLLMENSSLFGQLPTKMIMEPPDTKLEEPFTTQKENFQEETPSILLTLLTILLKMVFFINANILKPLSPTIEFGSQPHVLKGIQIEEY